jgi:hypothetical protein
MERRFRRDGLAVVADEDALGMSMQLDRPAGRPAARVAKE